MAVEYRNGYAAFSEGICPEPLPEYTLDFFPTDYGKVPVAQIPRPDKPKLFLFPGFAGYPDPTGEVLDALSSDFWAIEFGEPYQSPNRNRAEQHIADANAFEQVIAEHIPLAEGEKGTFVGASFATLTLAEFADHNLPCIGHAVFITPAGCLKHDNLVALGFRYGRETVRNSARAVKEYGRDALLSPLGTSRKAASDIPASLRRGQTVVRQMVARKILGLALAGVRVTSVFGTDDGLFDHRLVNQTMQEELTAMYAEANNEPGMIFAADIPMVDDLIATHRIPGGHDLGCTGRPRAYGELIKKYSLS
jgi:hypothetical protein